MQITGHRRAHLSVQSMLHVLEENGLEPSLCLDGTGLSPADILSAETEFSDGQEIEILLRGLELLPAKAGYGIRAGGTFQTITYGAWGLAILSSPRIREALEVTTRYSKPFMLSDLKAHEDQQKYALEVDMLDLPTLLHRYVFERVYSSYMMFVRNLLPGQDLSIFELWLPFSDSEYERQLADLTGIRVIPNQPYFAIAKDIDWLEQPLPQTNPVVHAHFKTQLQLLLKEQQDMPDHAQLIRDHMIETDCFTPRLEDVAAKARMSGRSLRRRLQDEGTSFKETVLSTKMAIAKEYLATAGLTVSSTAHRLGYAEVASFSRAYSRWWGHSPGQARNEAGLD